MDAKAIVDALAGHKGQHVPIQWRRSLHTLKDVDVKVEKQTTCYVRAGIEYANLRSVREAIAEGERGEVGPLKGADEWVEYPFIIRNGNTGEMKVRLYPAVFQNLPRRTEYFIDGEPATFEDVRPLCRASEFPKPGAEPPACFTVKASDVVSVAEALALQ